MILELKHLVGYLPYELQGKTYFIGEHNSYVISTNNIHSCLGENSSIKPILRPLSSLTKEIEVNGKKFVPIEKLDNSESDRYSFSLNYYINHTQKLPYYLVEKLYEWHFDVHGLIEKGLAVKLL